MRGKRVMESLAPFIATQIFQPVHSSGRKNWCRGSHGHPDTSRQLDLKPRRNQRGTYRLSCLCRHTGRLHHTDRAEYLFEHIAYNVYHMLFVTISTVGVAR